MNTGSPNEKVATINITRFLLGEEDAIKMPFPTRQELFEVLHGAMKEAKPHLHYVCHRIYIDCFPHLSDPPLIEATTKCFCVKLPDQPDLIQYIIVTRNGAIFLQEAWLQKRPKLKPRAIMLTQEEFSSNRLGLTELGWLRIVFWAIHGVRAELNNQAHSLRNRASDYDRTALRFTIIEDRLSHIS